MATTHARKSTTTPEARKRMQEAARLRRWELEAEALPASPVAPLWAARMHDAHDVRTMARELGTSVEDMQAQVDAEAAIVREYRESKSARMLEAEARTAAHAEHWKSDEGAAKRALGRAALTVASGKAVRVRMSAASAVVTLEALKVDDTDKRRRWCTHADIVGAAGLDALRYSVPELEARRAGVMPKRFRHVGPKHAKPIRDNESPQALAALEIAGASMEAIAAVRAEYARIAAEYDALKVGAGAQDVDHASVQTEEEKRAAARARKAEYRARKRIELGVIARGYNKGGMGR